MKLLTLQLENFQGIKSATFDFEGQSASIHGDNATGKTTVYNAIAWLLFDKASTGAKNFTPKTKNADGDAHFLDHSAKARFCMDGGRVFSLRKVYREVYKKKRGSAAEEFDGHTIDYYIDGVPVKEKEYLATLMTYCGNTEKMKMLTMPDYFCEGMTWEARRKILLDICGDATDEEVIESTADLKELPAYLLMSGTTDQYYTVDEYKKIAGAQKVDINRQLQGIPGRIDEAQRAVPDSSDGLAADTIDKRLEELGSERENLCEKKAAILDGDTSAADIRRKIADANARMSEARAAYVTKSATVNEGTQKAIVGAKYKILDLNSDIRGAEDETVRRKRAIERMQGQRNAFLEEYETVRGEVWDEGRAICPTCNRDLPEEDVALMREDFNLKKSQRLHAINERGKKEASKEMIEAEQMAIVKLTEIIATENQERSDLNNQIAALEKKLVQTVPFEETEEYGVLTAEVATHKAQEAATSESITEAAKAVKEQIEAVNEQIKIAQEQKAQIAQAQAQQKRIEELKASEKLLSAQYEELEKGIYLCDLFTKAKVSMLTDRINAKFKSVGFRLFIEQQNGGVRDDCEVMIPSEGGRMVPFAFANNAARINAGLEIIDTLSKHWGVSVPVFIDNAESVTHLARMDTQVIRLVVSADDVALRLELQPKEI